MSKTDKIISELKRETKQQKSIIGELVKYVDDLTRSNNRMTRTINSLTKSNDKLKHKLSYYDNPHTPPSRKPLQVEKDKNEKKDTESNRGGVFGHKGKTQTSYHKKRHIMIQHLVQNVKVRTLLRLTQKNATWLGIPPPQEYNVTEHILHKYTCKSCKKTFENDGKLAPRGQFDATVIKSIVSMFSKRMPSNTIRESLQEQYGLQISNNLVRSILQTGQML